MLPAAGTIWCVAHTTHILVIYPCNIKVSYSKNLSIETTLRCENLSSKMMLLKTGVYYYRS